MLRWILGGTLVGAVAATVASDLRTSMGGSVTQITARTAGSPHCVDGRFVNVEPTEVVSRDAAWPAVVAGFLERAFATGPKGGLPCDVPDFGGDPAALAVTWFGHASTLVEVDGCRVLTDPMWSRCVSPTRLFGLRRFHPPPIPLAALPALDAIVLSHDHFDHLDPPSVHALTENSQAPFVVPLGVGAHLDAWGVPSQRIIELDWWQDTHVGSLTITCTPARHYSGRTILSNNTLWSSWAIVGPHHRTYFGGDTGPTRLHAEIAQRLGPFDLTLLPIGAYDDAWPDIHLNPPQAWAAHLLLGTTTSTFLPIHWATFPLAPHPWDEPIEWLLRVSRGSPSIITPAPGRRVVLDDPASRAPDADARWWDGSARRPTSPAVPPTNPPTTQYPTQRREIR